MFYMYRKGVAALIINNNQEFLLVNLISFKEKYFAIPGGGSEPNESLEDTVYREIKEELGIEKEYLELVGKSDNPIYFKFAEIKLSRNGIEYGGSEKYFFGFKFIGDDSEIKLQEDEVRSYKWVPFLELKNYLLFDNQLKDTEEKIKELFGNNFINKNIRIGIYGILIKNNHLLMIKKSRGPYKGKYDLPGGKIEENESLEQALEREFIEETGLKVEIGNFIASNESDEHYKNDRGEDREIYLIGSYYFVSTQFDNIKENPDGQDSLGALFVPLNEVTEENTSRMAFKIINENLIL